MAELRASANIRGGRIDVGVTWVGPGPRPEARVVRRRLYFPPSVDSGLVVLDLAGVFELPDRPWDRIEKRRFLVDNALAEGGLLQAQVDLHYAAGATEPLRAVVTVYDASADANEVLAFDEVTRVVTTGTTTDIFIAPGGGPEVSAGTFVVTAGAPGHFEWNGTTTIGVDFDLDELQITRGTRLSLSPLHVSFDTEQAGARIRFAELAESFDPDTGDWTRVLTIADEEPSTRGPSAPAAGLGASSTYYYAVFVRDSTGDFTTEPGLGASATATGSYGLADRLYELLPAVHRYYDDPASGKLGSFQLKRFLHGFGAGLDQLRSLGESLSARHDLFEVRADHLPHLARWIGWDPDHTLPSRLQRTDILFAPEVFSTVGTAPNVKALANRMTGWECDIKEFVQNVAMTNAPEANHLWEIWESSRGIGTFLPPAPQADLYPDPAVSSLRLPAAFDGRPAAVLAGTDPVLFWHSNRIGSSRFARRQIWFQRLDGLDPLPTRALTDLDDDDEVIDEAPAVVADGTQHWLFWSSTRGGAWNLWSRRFTGSPLVGDTPARITDHPAEDRWPAAVREGTGRIWLFWQSNRRRSTWDIWATSTMGGTAWDPPARVTSGRPRDRSPFAVVDGTGQLRLFWSADRGDRSTIVESALGGGGFGAPQDVTQDTHSVRDESPSAVVWAGGLWLFWHSNQGGVWRIWVRIQPTGGVWGSPMPLFDTVAAWKEPMPLVDSGGALRLYMRSQRSGVRLQTRTVDTADTALLDSMRTRLDRLHYTYDPARTKDAWYAREAVGLYLSPNDGATDAEHRQKVRRLRAFATPFRPLPARFIWFLQLGTGDFEPVESDG